VAEEEDMETELLEETRVKAGLPETGLREEQTNQEMGGME